LDDVELPDSARTSFGVFLIVDDNPVNLGVAARLLRTHYKVLAAPAESEPCRSLPKCRRIYLILLDVMMPVMSGYEVLARLRENHALRDVPVIFVTGTDSTEDEAKGLARGAADYIAKPSSPSIVLARVRTHLELMRARVRLAEQNAFLTAAVRRDALQN